MGRQVRRTLWAGSLVALSVLVTALVISPGSGFSGTSPLWSERQVTAAPATVPAPAWAALARELKPAVVNISTMRKVGGPRGPGAPDGDPFNEFFRQFGQGPRRPVKSLGAGFVINPQGYIVTNNHVVDDATEIKVKFSDARELPAKIVGRDPKTDLALLKVEARELPVIPLGDSATLEVGEPVMAIGNPFGLEQTVTTGIVSATGRVIGEGPYDDFIQTDASINPGNSGGPLINARGQAIGINTAIFSQSGGSVGIGFAIPVNSAKTVIAQLADSGHVSRGYLGVSVQRLTPELARAFHIDDTRGALVAAVADGSPAAKAGIKAGDVIVEYDGRKVGSLSDLPRVVASTAVGREVPVTVVRSGKTIILNARIMRLEEPTAASPAAKAAGATSLGLAVQPLTPAQAQQLGLADSRGVLVVGVDDTSPAATAGIQAGDVIVSIDHRDVRDVDTMKRVLAAHQAGTPILFQVHRDAENLYLAVAV